MPSRSDLPTPERPKTASAPVQDFLESLEALDRSATRLEKLSRRRLLEQLSAGSPQVDARKLLRHLGTVTRRFEQIRKTLQADELGLLAEQAATRGAARLAELVERGELIEPAQLTERLDWTRQALSKALGARRVFHVEVRGARYYPAWFADPRYERRHLEAVSRSLGDLPGTTKLLFFSTPKASLAGRSPLEALADGKLADVLRAAEGFAQR